MEWFFEAVEAKSGELNDTRVETNKLWIGDPENQAYHAYSGTRGKTSFRTIWQSREQTKLVVASCAWYILQLILYVIAANYLVYMTFTYILPDSPSYAGSVSGNGKSVDKREELWDLGFHVTPDWSHRPWWLKFAFVDLNVNLAMVVPPLCLLLLGQTKRFVRYTATLGMINLFKAVIQILTVLPPANEGENCWAKNFNDQQLETMAHAPFRSWFYEPWGSAHGCNDMLWSGHTAQSCVGFLFLYDTLTDWRVPFALRFLLVPYVMTYWWAVLALRMHYSIDVLVATLVAVTLYTHAGLQATLWRLFNKAVCNEAFPEALFGFQAADQLPDQLPRASYGIV